jgi:Polysaccharide lyase
VSGTLLDQIDYAGPSPFGWTWQIQAGNYGLNDSNHSGSIFESVADPNGGSRKVAHVYLPARSSGGRAAEGTAKRYVDLGTTDYYGFSIRVPVGWHSIPQDPNWHTVAAQFNYGSLGGPPVSVVAQPNDLEVMILSGLVSSSSGSVTGYEFQASPNSNSIAGTRLYLLQNLSAYEGQWIDVVIGIKWATTWNGWVDGWVRTSGGTWQKVVNTLQTYGKLVPTQQWGSGEDVQTDVNGIVTGSGGSWPSLNVPGHPMFTTDKAGLYAGPGSTPMNVWESAFLRGTTFDVVASKLP